MPTAAFWVIVGLLAWLVLGAMVALWVGRTASRADDRDRRRREAFRRSAVLTPARPRRGPRPRG